MRQSLTSVHEDELRRKRASNWEHSVGARDLIWATCNNIIGMCVKGDSRVEIDIALDTLSCLTGIPRVKPES